MPDLIDITQPARPDPRVDEEWPKEGRDYFTDEDGNWVWASEINSPNYQPPWKESLTGWKRDDPGPVYGRDYFVDEDGTWIWAHEAQLKWEGGREEREAQWEEEDIEWDMKNRGWLRKQAEQEARLWAEQNPEHPRAEAVRVQNYDNGGGVNTLPEDQDVPVSGIASFLPGPGGADFPIPPTYIGPSSDEPRLDVLSEGTKAYESLPIWEQVAMGVTPAGAMADIMMAAKYGRDTLEGFIAENYGAAAVALTMTALAGVGFIPGVGDAVKVGGQKLLRKLGVPKPRVQWRPDMPPEEKAQWFREFGESFGGHDKDPLSVSSLKEIPWEKKVELMGGYDIPPLVAPHNRTGIEKLLPQKYAQRVRDWRVDRQQGTRDRFKQEEDAYWKELWKQRDSELFAPLDVDKIKREIEVKGETLGEYVPTLDEELDNVVDFPRRGGIENLIHPDLLKKRVFLWEEYGLDEADLVRLTKTMQEYEATGVLHADFSRKLTPQDLRDITGIEGGNPWEPDNFAYGGGVNSLYIDQGVPVNGIASFRPSV